VYKFRVMRTNVDIDDELMEKAMQLSNLKTKKEVVEAALQTFVRKLKQRRILELRGKVNWEGDLDDMRTSKYL
jgi:Arc/MetJ family transcription regulator